jgi:hypothetical protein
MTESILQEADRIINGDRQRDYGHPFYDFSATVGMLNALGFRRYAKSDLKELRGLIPEDFADIMTCCKKSRDWNMPKDDNLVDDAGYTGTKQKVREFRDTLECKIFLDRLTQQKSLCKD